MEKNSERNVKPSSMQIASAEANRSSASDVELSVTNHCWHIKVWWEWEIKTSESQPCTVTLTDIEENNLAWMDNVKQNRKLHKTDKNLARDTLRWRRFATTSCIDKEEDADDDEELAVQCVTYPVTGENSFHNLPTVDNWSPLNNGCGSVVVDSFHCDGYSLRNYTAITQHIL